MTAAIAYVHPWEAAGLGKAPFVWTGISEERGPKRFTDKDGLDWMVGAPGQPMGCCAYCGQGIAECHHIRSADGKEFTVGCDCVRKVESKGSPVYAAAERARRDRSNAKARARHQGKAKASKAELAELLRDPALRAHLASEPHPHPWRAEQGDTRLDGVEWRAAQSGHAGRVRLIAFLKDETAKLAGGAS